MQTACACLVTNLILVSLPGFLSSLLCFYRIDLFRAVKGMCKNSGASKMAKSLFASLPQRIPKKAVSLQKQNDVFVKDEGNNSHKHMNIQGQFHEFHKAFSIHSHHHVNIGLHMLQNRMLIYRIRVLIPLVVEYTLYPPVLSYSKIFISPEDGHYTLLDIF